jgi:hypothetical protein
MTQCSCWTHTQHGRSLTSQGGGPCTRAAKFKDAQGRLYCAQHAKEPATVLRKATGRLRAGLQLIEPSMDDFGEYLEDMRQRAAVRNHR